MYIHMIIACPKFEDKSNHISSIPHCLHHPSVSPLILHRPQRGAPRAVCQRGRGVPGQTVEGHDLRQRSSESSESSVTAGELLIVSRWVHYPVFWDEKPWKAYRKMSLDEPGIFHQVHLPISKVRSPVSSQKFCHNIPRWLTALISIGVDSFISPSFVENDPHVCW